MSNFTFWKVRKWFKQGLYSGSCLLGLSVFEWPFMICSIFSLHNIPAIEEIYKDACQWASQGGNPKAVSNASLAAAWLEAVFPCLISHLGGSSVSVWKAFPHVPFNSSLCLQVC